MTLPVFDVDGLAFDIPATFLATKYDGWAFYRNQVERMDGAKAVDLLIIAQDGSEMFLVEVKDYSRHARTKPSTLADEMAAKVLHSLGGILAARTRAVVNLEQAAADAACRARKLRVVLHLEQPAAPTPFRQAINAANLQIKLRQTLKAFDPHVLVVSRTSMGNLAWMVA